MGDPIGKPLGYSERLVAALRRLQAGYEPHSCGGFSKDDIALAMGVWRDCKFQDAIDALEADGGITVIGVDPETDEACFLVGAPAVAPSPPPVQS